MRRRILLLSICGIVSSSLINAQRQAIAEAIYDASFSIQGNPIAYSDLINNPNDFWSYNGNVITYKFDANFLATFTDPRIENEVRLAFANWDNAFATNPGNVFSYIHDRDDPFKTFVDIRSVATHEIGHSILGLAHVDQAAAVNKNYRLIGNVLTQAPDVGTEVMQSGLAAGRINHILSADELDVFKRTYNRDINFVEVPANMPAQITVSTYQNVSNNWAIGVPTGNPRNPNDFTQGVQINSSLIQFNTSAAAPLGFEVLNLNWDCSIPSKSTTSIIITTKGTNNLNPISHYDNAGPNAFQTYSTQPAGPNARESVTHTWSNPVAPGNPPQIPPNTTMHVGIGQDVYDWTVTSARQVDAFGAQTAIPLTAVHSLEFRASQAGNAPVQVPLADSNDETDNTPPDPPVATGFDVVNSDTPCGVGSIGIADVTGFGLSLAQLNKTTANNLVAANLMQFVNIGNVNLNPGDDFAVLFSGQANNLPASYQNNNNYALFPEANATNKEWFVWVETTGASAFADTYGLIGNAPVVGLVPEPSTLALIALLPLTGRRQRRFRRNAV